MKRKRNNKTEAWNTTKTLPASWQSWTRGGDRKQELYVSLVINFVGGVSTPSYVRTYLKLDSKSNSYGDRAVALEHSSPDWLLFALCPIAFRAKRQNSKTETGKWKTKRRLEIVLWQNGNQIFIARKRSINFLLATTVALN